MNTLFEKLCMGLISERAKVTMELCRAGESDFTLVAFANIGETPANASEQEVAIRSAIATPFAITGSPREISESLEQRLGAHVRAINSAARQLEQINKSLRTAEQSRKEDKTSQQESEASGDNAEDIFSTKPSVTF